METSMFMAGLLVEANLTLYHEITISFNVDEEVDVSLSLIPEAKVTEVGSTHHNQVKIECFHVFAFSGMVQSLEAATSSGNGNCTGLLRPKVLRDISSAAWCLTPDVNLSEYVL